MMSRNQLIALLLVIALGAGGTWLWFELLEQRMDARVHVSDAARENPMLAATLLLQARRHPVTLVATLSEIEPARLADGTLLLAQPNGLVTETQAAALLAWVRRGNTLVTRPRWIAGAETAVAFGAGHTRVPPPSNDVESEDDEAASPKADIEHEAKSKTKAENEAANEAETETGAEAGTKAETETGAGTGADAKQTHGAASAPGTSPTPQPAATHTQRVPRAPLGAAVEFDPLAVRLGVRSVDAQARTARCAPSAPPVPMAADTPKGNPARVFARWRSLRLVCATLPDSGHVVELDTDGTILASLRGAATPVMADARGEAVRVYAEGKGHIVMLATNYFDNGSLQHFDHAELLLYLAHLNPDKPAVTIVQRLDIVRWYRALWQNYPRFLVSAALALVLLLFAAIRRFGPLLPAPALERRALIEHIDASGAWLWKLPGGRLLLLDAVRASVNALLARRVHALRTLGPADQCALLARATTLTPAALDDALFAPPASLPRDFTRQIRTLMQLRNHYER